MKIAKKDNVNCSLVYPDEKKNKFGKEKKDRSVFTQKSKLANFTFAFDEFMSLFSNVNCGVGRWSRKQELNVQRGTQNSLSVRQRFRSSCGARGKQHTTDCSIASKTREWRLHWEHVSHR